MDNQDHIIQSALASIPQFKDIKADDYSAERLGGLTNLVFKITMTKENFILRIPGAGTSEYIDRRVEAFNAQVAAEADVSAEVIFADGESGIMVSRFLEGALTMSPDEFGKRQGSPARAARALRQMHQCGKEFKFHFELFTMIDDYLKILDNLGANIPDGYAAVVKEAEGIREALEKNPLPLAPSHCDPLCENFLDNGSRMWIVDWEYSGMNDPIWDLGDLSVEAGFTPEQDMEMMMAYCDGTPSAAFYGRMVIYKAMCDLLWTLWGLIQHANGNVAEDFWAYATLRFERCKALMSAESFGGYLDAVRVN